MDSVCVRLNNLARHVYDEPDSTDMIYDYFRYEKILSISNQICLVLNIDDLVIYAGEFHNKLSGLVYSDSADGVLNELQVSRLKKALEGLSDSAVLTINSILIKNNF